MLCVIRGSFFDVGLSWCVVCWLFVVRCIAVFNLLVLVGCLSLCIVVCS